MTPARVAALFLLVGWLLLTATALTGCSTLGISFETDYGKFTYQLPEVPALKDK